MQNKGINVFKQGKLTINFRKAEKLFYLQIYSVYYYILKSYIKFNSKAQIKFKNEIKSQETFTYIKRKKSTLFELVIHISIEDKLLEF